MSENDNNEALPQEISTNDFVFKMNECLSDLSKVSKKMNEIKDQGGWKTFWNNSDNIKDIASHVDLTSSILQRNLELSLLLMNGSVCIKKDYDRLISEMESSNDQYANQVEVLEVICRFKKMICNLKDREDTLNDLIKKTEKNGDDFENLTKIINNIENLVNNEKKVISESINNAMFQINEVKNEIKNSQKYYYEELEKFKKNELNFSNNLFDLNNETKSIKQNLEESEDMLKEFHKAINTLKDNYTSVNKITELLENQTKHIITDYFKLDQKCSSNFLQINESMTNINKNQINETKRLKRLIIIFFILNFLIFIFLFLLKSI